MSLPFDGAISHFYENEAPKDVRKIVKQSGKDPILEDGYPYSERLNKHDYEDQLHALKIELCKMQAWATDTGARILTVFEGRDAAGKGGSIKRVIENLNPRAARIVALTKPSDRESTQWYFQRYIEMLPAGGEITLFDRSWYNRGVVEHVFGFCTTNEREAFFRQVPQFEQMLIDEGIHLVKIWLNVGRAEQLRRLLPDARDVQVGGFAGVLDPSRGPWWTRLLLRALARVNGVAPGDYRDWSAIRAWSRGLVSGATALSGFAQQPIQNLHPPLPERAGIAEQDHPGAVGGPEAHVGRDARVAAAVAP